MTLHELQQLARLLKRAINELETDDISQFDLDRAEGVILDLVEKEKANQ